MFWRVIENVIKYDLCVKFPRNFAHNVQIAHNVPNSVVKSSLMFVQYFEYYAIILRGRFFGGHAVVVFSEDIRRVFDGHKSKDV